jgi:hypothetical protein
MPSNHTAWTVKVALTLALFYEEGVLFSNCHPSGPGKD